MIQMQPCNSSQAKAFGYEEVSSTLRIQFANGGTYDYIGVPKDVFDDLRAADSIGRFIAERLKNKFEYRRVS